MTIKGIFEFAPTDRNVAGPFLDGNNLPWAVVLPACDGDVFDLQGVKPFDRMLKENTEIDTAASLKVTYFVYGANHNFYNTQWQTSDSSGCEGTDNNSLFTTPTSDGMGGFGSANQRKSGLSAFLAFFRSNVGSTVNVVLNQNFDPRFELPTSVSSITKIKRGFTVSPSTSKTQKFNALAFTGNQSDICAFTTVVCSDNSPLTLQATAKQVQLAQSGFVEHDDDFFAASISWHSPGPDRYFQTNFETSAFVNATTFQTVDFRVSRRRNDDVAFQLEQNLLNSTNITNFSIQLVMNNGTVSAPVGLQKYVILEGPVGLSAVLPMGMLHPILQTVRIPLTDFTGADLTQVKGVRFIFNDTSQGAIFLSDVRLSK